MPSCTASNPSHDFVLVYPLCCNDDRAGEIGTTFHFMTRHDLVLANDTDKLRRSLMPVSRHVMQNLFGNAEKIKQGAFTESVDAGEQNEW